MCCHRINLLPLTLNAQTLPKSINRVIGCRLSADSCYNSSAGFVGFMWFLSSFLWLIIQQSQLRFLGRQESCHVTTRISKAWFKYLRLLPNVGVATKCPCCQPTGVCKQGYRRVYLFRTSVSATALTLRTGIIVFQFFYSERVMLAMMINNGSEINPKDQWWHFPQRTHPNLFIMKYVRLTNPTGMLSCLAIVDTGNN